MARDLTGSGSGAGEAVFAQATADLKSGTATSDGRPTPIPAPAKLSEIASPSIAPVMSDTSAAATATVHVHLVCGGITNVKAPVAVVARYDGVPLPGQARAYDRKLDSWLTRGLELGMIGSGLGQLFPINLQHRKDEGKSNIDVLLLAGMGEPGRFAQDDLRFLMSNITVAVKSMRYDTLCIGLLGTRRGELRLAEAVRGLLEGIKDGYTRFRAVADVVTENRAAFDEAFRQSLSVILVEPDDTRLTQIQKAFEESSIPGLHLEVDRVADVPADPVAEASALDTDPDVQVTLLRATRHPSAVAGSGNTVLQFSALSETAAVTVREMEVNGYLIRALPDRMMAKSCPSVDRENFCRFFTQLVIPDEFRKFTEGSTSVTLEVDQTTALYPWEMAAHKKYSNTSFLGTTVAVSRQFRTLLSPAPSSPPPLNRSISFLIIADPASGNLSLAHAREEGLAVLEVLDRARRAWRGHFDIKATVRIGSRTDPALNQILDSLHQRYSWIDGPRPCDPLELTMLIVNEQYDVIHYAGHGLYEEKTNRAGWVFDRDCFITANEIFRVRQVPRLVFANACYSAKTLDEFAADGAPRKPIDPDSSRGQLVAVAQAFFARGIPNFIGTGWAVNDAAAQVCAQWFYARVLGLDRPTDAESVIGASPPATIGEALLEARRKTFEANATCSTWGAYQHYGRVSDKLLPFANASPKPEAPAETK
jgi:hypothetical protein